MNHLKNLLLLMFLGASTSFAQYSWVIQNGPVTGEQLNDVFMLNSFEGYAIGENATSNAVVYKTGNGGSPWVANYAMTGEGALSAGWWENYGHGYVVAEDGDVYETLDSALSWSLIYDETAAANAFNMFVAGNRIFTTRSSEIKYFDGSNWVTTSGPISGDIFGIHFSDDQNGWICGYGGQLAYTQDGGDSWNNISAPSLFLSSDLYAVYSHTAGSVWCVGSNGALFSTTNYGATWDTHSINPQENLNDIHFHNGTHGIAVGANNTAYYTTDGGTTWVSQPANGSSVHFNAVMATNTIKAFMVGGDAEIWKSPNSFDIANLEYIGPDTVCAGVPFEFAWTFENIGQGACDGAEFLALINSFPSSDFPVYNQGITNAGEIDTASTMLTFGAGNHSIYLYATDTNETSNNFIVPNFVVTAVLPNPTNVTGGTYFCPGDTVKVTASGGVSYNWLSGSNTGDVTDPSQEYYPTTDETYVVEIIQEYCTLLGSATALLDPNCVVDTVIIDTTISPSESYAFSPNNDGTNDVFILDFLSSDLDNTVTVFNRWGDIVFEADGYNNEDVVWDGTFKNRTSPSGTYFFVVSSSQNGDIKGWVQLVR